MKNKTAASLAILFALIILGTWGNLWSITNHAYRDASPKDLQSHGQFGDAFGSLNALFTGLALAGLVYTAILQHRQTDAQTEQLKMQKAELAQQDVALKRQARQQFLTARLNAQTAILHSHGVAVQLGFGGLRPEAGRAQFAANCFEKMRSNILVLFRESQLPDDGTDWSPAVEKEAVRRHAVSLVRGLAVTCSRKSESTFTIPTDREINAVSEELEALLEIYPYAHPDIAQCVGAFAKTLRECRSDPATVIQQCQQIDDFWVAGRFPWF